MNLKNVSSLKEFHELVKKSFSFPDYYGENQDAFWDYISEIFEPTEVKIIGYNELNTEMKSEIKPYFDILIEYQNSESNFKVKSS